MAASPQDPAATPVGDAARRVRRAKLFIFLAIRSVHVAQGFVSVIGGQSSFRSRKWANATLALTTVETAWVAARQWRASQNLASVALVDAATSVVGMGMIGVATDPTSRTTSLNWMLPYGVGSTVGLAFALPRRHGALLSAGMAGAYLYTTRESFARRADATTAVSNALSFVGFHLIVSVLADVTGRFGDEVDAARRVAVESGQALATEQERNRQHRLLHDSVLQTLEAVASGRVDDPAVIRARASDESRRLRADLQPRTTPDDLVAALTQLIGETEPRLDLRVDLVAPEQVPATSAVVTAALVDATREALTNVSKHSGVNRAVLRVRSSADRIEVIVRDEGTGFDQATTVAGFGTSQSITMRMREAGGGVDVRSAPGEGTRVHLWAPAR
ncbi:MAG TPA: ATP-binding protein [Acidimicrobiia bacterium]|jgi:signal transduction histidine kinase